MAGMVGWELLGAVWTEDEILGRYKLKYVNLEFQLLNWPIVGLIIIICQIASVLLHWCGILVNRHSTCCKPLRPIIHDRQHPEFPHGQCANYRVRACTRTSTIESNTISPNVAVENCDLDFRDKCD